jgi:hypothetical protein
MASVATHVIYIGALLEKIEWIELSMRIERLSKKWKIIIGVKEN